MTPGEALVLGLEPLFFEDLLRNPISDRSNGQSSISKIQTNNAA